MKFYVSALVGVIIEVTYYYYYYYYYYLLTLNGIYSPAKSSADKRGGGESRYNLVGPGGQEGCPGPENVAYVFVSVECIQF